MRLLITGGAGFIGSNAARFFIKRGDQVWIFDNLSRKGSNLNLNLLLNDYPRIKFIKGDILNFDLLKKQIKNIDVILHFAGQVAVTTSIENPHNDFEINALGTLNVLEAIRQVNPKAIFIYSSTNKVYGSLEKEAIIESSKRYDYKNLKKGISEEYPLDFHSPYGCSKGCADQYTHDYSRIYGLNTIVFRQSCIYGPYQFGVEDQGWVAWFIIAHLFKKKISIYGNGKQVRDILYIDDLLNAYERAIAKVKITKGKIYNIGGGEKFNLSIWREFEPLLKKTLPHKVVSAYDRWRAGDQKIYISDVTKANKDFGWKPKTTPADGIRILTTWLSNNKDIISKALINK